MRGTPTNPSGSARPRRPRLKFKEYPANVSGVPQSHDVSAEEGIKRPTNLVTTTNPQAMDGEKAQPYVVVFIENNRSREEESPNTCLSTRDMEL